MPNAKFLLGQLVVTPAALMAIGDSGQSPTEFLYRHMQGDWGTVCSEDWKLNDEALVNGSRIISAFLTLKA